MSSPAEIPHRDEALKTLVARFKEAPGSPASTELAAALLARGHASEALRVAEHGLQLAPDDVEGRVERAAALLALGRPRVAYVELLRALAIQPTNRRGMRLLGRAFVDAGAPGRAAALLARRSLTDDAEERTSLVERRPPPPAQTAPMASVPVRDGTWKERPSIQPSDTTPNGPSGSAIPDLFSDLTADLGLGSAVPEGPQRRVEVTQIIRRKALPRPPRSASELMVIDGPIVDTTQPGHVDEFPGDEPAPQVTAREPVPLFLPEDASSLAGFSLDDEPLFQEHMPFAVRPVEGDSQDLSATLDEPEPLAGIRRYSAHDPSGDSDTVVEGVEEMEGPIEAISTLGPARTLSADLEEAPHAASHGTFRRDLHPPAVSFDRAATLIPDDALDAMDDATDRSVEALNEARGARRGGQPPEIPGGRGARAAHTAETASGGFTTAPAQPADPRSVPARAAGQSLLPTQELSLSRESELDARFEVALPVVEKSRPKATKPRLEVVDARPNRSHALLAAAMAALMVLYVVGLLWASADALSPWVSSPDSADAPKGSSALGGAVPESDAARAENRAP